MTYSVSMIDVYWTFILPIICSFSMFTNAINVIVFARIKSRDNIYKYMLINSIADEVYLFGVFFIFLVRCGQFCQIKDTYMAQFYAHYIYNYTTNSVALFSIFLEILIIVQRYFSLKNKKLLENVNKNLFFLCLLLLCFVYHIPQLSVFEIEQKNQTLNSSFVQQVIYTRKFNAYNKSFFKRNLLALQTMIRLILSILVIILLCRLSVFALKKYEAIQSNGSNEITESTSKTRVSSSRKS